MHRQSLIRRSFCKDIAVAIQCRRCIRIGLEIGSFGEPLHQPCDHFKAALALAMHLATYQQAPLKGAHSATRSVRSSDSELHAFTP